MIVSVVNSFLNQLFSLDSEMEILCLDNEVMNDAWQELVMHA